MTHLENADAVAAMEVVEVNGATSPKAKHARTMTAEAAALKADLKAMRTSIRTKYARLADAEIELAVESKRADLEPKETDAVPAKTPSEIVPLIKKGLAAGERSYRLVGTLLLQAKSLLKRGEFKPWLAANFDLSYRSAADYMRLATAKGAEVCTLREAATDPETRRNARQVVEPSSSPNAAALIEAMMEIVSRGYEALALECAPDAGGDAAVMATVTAARDRLLRWIQRQGAGVATSVSHSEMVA